MTREEIENKILKDLPRINNQIVSFLSMYMTEKRAGEIGPSEVKKELYLKARARRMRLEAILIGEN